jgi:hypothetical protein
MLKVPKLKQRETKSIRKKDIYEVKQAKKKKKNKYLPSSSYRTKLDKIRSSNRNQEPKSHTLEMAFLTGP